jgi:RimJ/RimL family protein N-acetyltransferase
MLYIPEGPFTPELAKAFVAENSGEQARFFAVLLKAADLLIGHMEFHPWFAPQTYEIGWVFDRAYHGRGYATEAAVALLRHGFEALDLHRIIATCQPENVASRRVMEKLGMRLQTFAVRPPLELALHPECPGLEVHFRSHQPEELALPQPAGDGHDVERLVTIHGPPETSATAPDRAG